MIVNLHDEQKEMELSPFDPAELNRPSDALVITWEFLNTTLDDHQEVA